MDRAQEDRRTRYVLRDRLRQFSAIQRQQDCGADSIGFPAVLIRSRELGEGSASWLATVQNVEMCQRLTCPTCAPVMWSLTAAELSAAVLGWQAEGGEVAYVTLRLKPGAIRALELRIDALRAGWRSVLGGNSQAQRRRMEFLGKVGFHMRIEIEDGLSRGWEPHLRALLFVDGFARNPAVTERRLAEAIWPAWQSGLARAGHASPARPSGIAVELVERDPTAAREVVMRYLASIDDTSRIRSRHHNRSMWAVLDDALYMHRLPELRWNELERMLIGRRIRTWSPGFRKQLGMPANRSPRAAPDEQVLAYLDWSDWSKIDRRVCDMLEAVENAGPSPTDTFAALSHWLANIQATPPLRNHPVVRREPQPSAGQRQRSRHW